MMHSLQALGEKVPASKTLLTPVQCKSLWRQFKTETEYTVTQAISAQEASKRGNNWLPPPWAVIALLLLGFNEFMTLLRNPLWLLIIFVGYLLAKALWVQLDISREFRNGALPGLLALSTKFLPAIMSLMRKLAEQGQGNASSDGSRNQSLAAKSFGSGNNNMSSGASSEVISTDNGTEYPSRVAHDKAQ